MRLPEGAICLTPVELWRADACLMAVPNGPYRPAFITW